MTQGKRTLTVALLGLLISVCTSTKLSHQKSETVKPSTNSTQSGREAIKITVTGTIQYKAFEGSFYGLIGDDGSRWTLTNLPDNFRRNGISVRMTGVYYQYATISTMFGQTLTVSKIERK